MPPNPLRPAQLGFAASALAIDDTLLASFAARFDLETDEGLQAFRESMRASKRLLAEGIEGVRFDPANPGGNQAEVEAALRSWRQRATGEEAAALEAQVRRELVEPATGAAREG